MYGSKFSSISFINFFSMYRWRSNGVDSWSNAVPWQSTISTENGGNSRNTNASPGISCIPTTYTKWTMATTGSLREKIEINERSFREQLIHKEDRGEGWRVVLHKGFRNKDHRYPFTEYLFLVGQVSKFHLKLKFFIKLL